MNPLTINTWKVLTVLNITKYQLNLIKLARAGFEGGIYGESAGKGDFGPHLKKKCFHQTNRNDHCACDLLLCTNHRCLFPNTHNLNFHFLKCFYQTQIKMIIVLVICYFRSNYWCLFHNTYNQLSLFLNGTWKVMFLILVIGKCNRI